MTQQHLFYIIFHEFSFPFNCIPSLFNISIHGKLFTIVNISRGETMDQNRFDKFYQLMQEIFHSSDLLNTYDSLPHPYGNYILYPKEALIISTIGDNPGITAKELSQKFNTSESACSQIVKKLLNKEWISRIADENNKRIYHLYLTDTGLDIYDQHKKWDHRCFMLNYNHLENYSTEDFEFFFKLLQDINYSLENGVEESKSFQLSIKEEKHPH